MLFSASTKSHRNWAALWKARASARSSSGTPASMAAAMASMASSRPSSTDSIRSLVRFWMVRTLVSNSSSEARWQDWQALLRLSSGLRTQWSLTLTPPSRT